MIKGKKIFLSGGAGFIGSALIARLIDHNEMVIYDTFARRSLNGRRFENHPNLVSCRGDILDFENVKKHIEGAHIVIHLAAIAGIDTVIKSPVNTMRVNMIGTSNMLEAASELPSLERFIDFSTSEVFGSYAYRSEEGDSTSLGAVGNARWTYAVSKLAGEHLSYSYYKEKNIPTTTIRPFNIYGPGQVGEGAVHHFITRALKGEDLVIRGNGDQIRSWCYIDDIVEAILAVPENDRTIGECFNIGNPRGTVTIYGLALAAIRVTYSKSKIVFVEKDVADVELRIPNIDKARSMLGFQPRVDLEEGLKLTADWYYDKIHADSAFEASLAGS
ncbi:MAG: NAD-dependent epimerase/dehydratase family protein [Candidatus Zixiibacteriota bacterium]|nr:MAG: NAD-dependent epimerase/dehydratase family protein [candidate division Zixibacteria bacterium]